MVYKRCLQWHFLWRLNGAANGASNGASNDAWKWHFQRRLNGAGMVAEAHVEWCLKRAWRRRLKCAWNGAPHRHWMALERHLNAYKKAWNIIFNTFFFISLLLLFYWPRFFVVSLIFRLCFYRLFLVKKELEPCFDTNYYSFWSPLSPTIETEHIYIYINPENMPCSLDREWTNLSPFCFSF